MYRAYSIWEILESILTNQPKHHPPWDFTNYDEFQTYEFAPLVNVATLIHFLHIKCFSTKQCSVHSDTQHTINLRKRWLKKIRYYAVTFHKNICHFKLNVLAQLGARNHYVLMQFESETWRNLRIFVSIIKLKARNSTNPTATTRRGPPGPGTIRALLPFPRWRPRRLKYTAERRRSRWEGFAAAFTHISAPERTVPPGNVMPISMPDSLRSHSFYKCS
jgi:hypothetical protein